MAQLNFDANTVNPDQSFDPIPAGWYNMMITESEMKPTKDGSGSYLQMALKVIDGEFANRLVFDRLNLQNKNPVASEIAYKQLSAYCHAAGVMQIQDSQQLHGIPVKVRVKVRTDSTGWYDPSNEVGAVKNINDNGGATMAAGDGWGAMVAPRPPAFPPPAQQSWGRPPAPAGNGWGQPAPQQPPAYQPPAAQQAAPVQQPVAQPAVGADGRPVPPWAQKQ